MQACHVVCDLDSAITAAVSKSASPELNHDPDWNPWTSLKYVPAIVILKLRMASMHPTKPKQQAQQTKRYGQIKQSDISVPCEI